MNKTELKNTIKTVGAAIKTSTQPIFECIHMDAHSIKGGNSLFDIEAKCDTGLSEPVSVNFNQFKGLVGSINADIDFSVKEKLYLKSGSIKATLAIMQKGYNFERNLGETSVFFETDELIETINQTKHALGKDMIGAYYVDYIEDDLLSVITLDGYRISSRGNMQEPKVLIPAEVGDVLPTVFSEGERISVTVYSNGAMRFTGDSITVTSGGRSDIRVMNFPYYLENINGDVALLPQEETLKALRTASVCGQTAKLSFSKNSMLVSAKGTYGDVSYPIECLYSGTEKEVSINILFLEDAIKSIPYVDINLTVGDDSSPLMIEEDKGRIKEIVLPVRTA